MLFVNKSSSFNYNKIKGGILFNSPKFYIGLSGLLMNRISTNKKQNYTGLYHLISGIVFKKSYESNLTVTPTILITYKNQYLGSYFINNIIQPNIIFNTNIEVKYKKMLFGAGNIIDHSFNDLYKIPPYNNDLTFKPTFWKSVTLMQGLQLKKMKLLLIQNYVSLMRNRHYFNFQLSAQYTFKKS